jgi:hypothetical protein
LEILKKYDLSKLKDFLTMSAGYHNEVIEDELHVYCISPSKEVDQLINLDASIELRAVYQKYLDRYKINLDTIQSLIHPAALK